MRTFALLALVALGGGAAPAMAQVHQHDMPAQGQPAKTQEMAMDMTSMVCTMGMLPHMGMGGEGMGTMGGMMKQGAQAGAGMQGMMGGMHGMQGKDSAQKNMKMDHAAMGGMQQMGQQSMMAHPLTPTMIIHHATDIGLSADQTAKVTELATSSRTSCEAHMKEAMAAHQAANALLGEKPDLAGYQGKLQEASTHMIAAHMTVLKAGVDANALLTPEQKQKLTESMKKEHAR